MLSPAADLSSIYDYREPRYFLIRGGEVLAAFNRDNAADRVTALRFARGYAARGPVAVTVGFRYWDDRNYSFLRDDLGRRAVLVTV
jgi:hypothetical protein